ncbi:RNA cytosine-C(5)-methyltransferase NSUN2-like [Haliotis rubra]|uniref:RNA cytosine-C(5)-methyltransferase NSUN2-like n=1 Tax=Haliotis rubra TaxID=36100 RepID=UPI001EE51BFA|nr:RNA cytosine-C(5)-methyltransferase NSUN2-like [Haliotis rubra]
MGRSKRGRKRQHQDWQSHSQTQDYRTQDRNYKLPERKNELFVKYYKEQKIVPEGEWETFEEILKTDLPVTFRITGSRKQAGELLRVIKGQYFSNLVNQTLEGDIKIEPQESTMEQKIVPEGEWETFEEILKTDLPVTFRITGSRKQAGELLRVIKGQYFSNLVNQTLEGDIKIEPPKNLPWYPEEMAWHIDMSRKYIRSSNVMQKLHEFLIAETESGNISRQEAVSMIPPLLMDIKPHHKILDMCAAPGSKTAQLIDYLHSVEDEDNPIPEGFVIANDKDNKRCYLMVHQVKRLQSPNFMIVNQDATIFPKIRITPQDEKPDFLYFDRILADVPCTGDGTMRKNPDVWGKWKPINGPNLHFLQVKILKRGLELLNEGGRLVYSTCSFNPIEDEAVVAEMLRQCKGSVELVDISESLPGLKFVPGLSKWRLMSMEGEWFDVFENVPKKWFGTFRPTMFPPSDEEVAWMNLNRCMRVLPHHQNTGGFFICALTKVTNLPWTKERKPVEQAEGTQSSDQESTPSESDVSSVERNPDGMPSQKRQKTYGFKEDPFLFMDADDKVWPPIKEFYKVPDNFPVTQIMYRSQLGNKKNLYYVSPYIRRIVQCNIDRIKFINMGFKLCSRNPSPIVPECDFRISQECVGLLYKWFPGRFVTVAKSDLIMLLSEENPYIIKFTKDTQEQIDKLGPGSAVFRFTPSEQEPEPKCDITVTGWRGKVSIRSFVSTFDRQHFLFLCGTDLQEIRARVQEQKARKKAAEAAKAANTDSSGKDEAGVGESTEGEGASKEDTVDSKDGDLKVGSEEEKVDSKEGDLKEVKVDSLTTKDGVGEMEQT